jgi:hypothetical protein
MKELIELAKQKGFESELKYLLNSNYKDLSEFDYLWMCELQKWLIEKEDLNVEVFSYNHKKFTLLISDYREIHKKEIWKHKGPYDKRNNAIEIGCFESLKLID